MRAAPECRHTPDPYLAELVQRYTWRGSKSAILGQLNRGGNRNIAPPSFVPHINI